MNLEESNEFIAFEQKKNKKKKIILFLILLLIISVILLIVFWVFLVGKQSKEAKLYFNGKKVQWPSGMFFTQNETTYVSVKDMVGFINGQYNKGEYKTYTQDKNYGYIQTKYEVISFNVGSLYVKKYIINDTPEQENISDTQVVEEENPIIVESENNAMELFELSSETILENDKIYIPMDDINRIFNVRCVVKENEINLYNLEYLYNYALSSLTSYNVTAISNSYENIRALSQNMVIVANKNDKYGVINLDSGETVLSYQYKKILYLQSTNEFFVYTDDSVGLLDANGETVIAPTKYDSLTVFDAINRLYLSEKNGKYGIVNDRGKEIVSTSFRAVGTKALVDIDEYELPDSETPNLLNSKYIIVADESYVGLFDIKGKRILKATYDDFGYVATDADKKKEIRSTLLIPKSIGVNGVIIKQSGYYGICDLDKGEILIPCSLSKIYCKTKNGETTYYMEIGDETLDIKQYLKENDLDSDDVENDDENNENVKDENNNTEKDNDNNKEKEQHQNENNVNTSQTSNEWVDNVNNETNQNNNNRNQVNDNQNQVNDNTIEENNYDDNNSNNDQIEGNNIDRNDEYYVENYSENSYDENNDNSDENDDNYENYEEESY